MKIMRTIQKIAAALLSTALLAGMAGCAATADSPAAGSGAQSAVTDPAAYTLTPDAVQIQVNGGGTLVALVVDSKGSNDGANNAAAWSGVQKFCQNFGFTGKVLVAADDTEAAAEDTLRTAAESGAAVVVCVGSAFATPLYTLQGNYPSVSYLMVDDEPHTADYAAYTTGSLVHCILFREEQAGYLAGYAAVAEGDTSIGFVGAEPMPEIVRYGAGFIQGAEEAAQQNGAQVTLKYWYSDTYTPDDDVTARMSGWYADGTQAVFACGGTLAQGCATAAEQNGGKVIAADYDQSALGATVLSSAVKCVSRAVQDQLYAFYANGAKWKPEAAGQTEQLGVSAQAVALPTAQWGFLNFTTDEYAALYGRLRSAELKVERYSDTTTMPETHNVTVDYQT